MPLAAILKPEYLYRPWQLLRRLRAGTGGKDAPVRVRLAGGADFVAPASDDIAKALLHLGVFDLVVTETLWRLIDPGEVVVDAGGNIGHMSSIMAARVGALCGGVVWALEPHPQLFRELQANCQLAATKHAGVQFELRNAALSKHEG